MSRAFKPAQRTFFLITRILKVSYVRVFALNSYECGKHKRAARGRKVSQRGWIQTDHLRRQKIRKAEQEPTLPLAQNNASHFSQKTAHCCVPGSSRNFESGKS
jgi:hypothetical protein